MSLSKTLSFNLPLFMSAPDYHDFGHFCYLLTELTGQEVNHEEITVDPEVGYGVDISYDGSRPFYYAIIFPGKRTPVVDELIDKFLNGTLDLE